MKIVIIEDEKAAVRNLTSLLNEIKPNGEIVTILDSISSTIEWFSSHPMLQGLQDAADKHQFPFPQQENELLKLIHSLQKQENYKSHFLIPSKGDKLLPVSVDMIQLFYIKDCQVKVVLTDETEYCFSQTLDELTECLNPSLFFRANRQYLISREAIKDIDLWFNSRLSINLYYSGIKEKILVSKARVAEFKEWFSKRKR